MCDSPFNSSVVSSRVEKRASEENGAVADGMIPGSSRFRVFKLLLEQVDAGEGSMALVTVFSNCSSSCVFRTLVVSLFLFLLFFLGGFLSSLVRESSK